jgi:hypothetical protein
MLNIFTSQKVQSRMQSGPMGPYLSEIVAMLCNQGYARSTICLHLRAADQFGAWLLKEGVSINDISTSTVIVIWKVLIVNILNHAQEVDCPIRHWA